MARGGKGTSAGSGPHTGSGRYGGTSGSQKGVSGSGGYDLNKDEDGGDGSDIDISSCYKARPRNPLTVSRERYNTKSYDKMRDRSDILRDLYASYEDGGVREGLLIVQILLDIRDILTSMNNKI